MSSGAEYSEAKAASRLMVSADRLDKSVANLEALVGSVRERLTPVRAVDGNRFPRNETDQVQPDREIEAPLTQRLRGTADHVDECCAKLTELLHELEL